MVWNGVVKWLTRFTCDLEYAGVRSPTGSFLTCCSFHDKELNIVYMCILVSSRKRLELVKINLNPVTQLSWNEILLPNLEENIKCRSKTIHESAVPFLEC